MLKLATDRRHRPVKLSALSLLPGKEPKKSSDFRDMGIPEMNSAGLLEYETCTKRLLSSNVVDVDLIVK